MLTTDRELYNVHKPWMFEEYHMTGTTAQHLNEQTFNTIKSFVQQLYCTVLYFTEAGPYKIGWRGDEARMEWKTGFCLMIIRTPCDDHPNPMWWSSNGSRNCVPKTGFWDLRSTTVGTVCIPGSWLHSLFLLAVDSHTHIHTHTLTDTGTKQRKQFNSKNDLH